MALIFFGTPAFAVPSLQALIDAGEKVVLVVTQPDKLKGRGRVLSSPSVKELALSHGIRVLQPPSIRDGVIQAELRAVQPDAIIVVAYGKLLPPEVLAVPVQGCVNVHASLLPRYRGAAPVQWAILRGEKMTGVTTMLMNEGLDTGDILLQKETAIASEDNGETLSRKLAVMSGDLLVVTLMGLRSGTVRPRPQQGEATYAPPFRKEDGRIDWTRRADELSFFVRGMYPWPCAFTTLDGEQIRIMKVAVVAGAADSGVVAKAGKGEFLVGTGRDLLRLDQLQPAGRKAMPAAAFLAGRRLREGHDRFV